MTDKETADLSHWARTQLAGYELQRFLGLLDHLIAANKEIDELRVILRDAGEDCASFAQGMSQGAKLERERLVRLISLLGDTANQPGDRMLGELLVNLATRIRDQQEFTLVDIWPVLGSAQEDLDIRIDNARRQRSGLPCWNDGCPGHREYIAREPVTVRNNRLSTSLTFRCLVCGRHEFTDVMSTLPAS